MNNYVLLALIAGAVIVPATIIMTIVFVKKYYRDKALVFEDDASGHLLPVKSFKVRRKKNEEVWHLAFFNRFFWNFQVMDKGFIPLTENDRRLYFFYRDRNGFMHDLRLDIDSVKDVYKVKCIPADVFSTQQAILHNLISTYHKQSWFDKYGPWLIGGALGALLVFAIIYQGHVTSNMADKAASVTDRCFQGCMNILNATQQNMTAMRVV